MTARRSFDGHADRAAPPGAVLCHDDDALIAAAAALRAAPDRSSL
ncbi:MAG: hypothetical protein WB611_17785 [Stellaceae bacterium]